SPACGRAVRRKLLQSAGPSANFPLSRCEAMGEGGRRPGEGSFCLPALRRGRFLQQNESDVLIELEQRALNSPIGHPLPSWSTGEGENLEVMSLVDEIQRVSFFYRQTLVTLPV